MNDASVNTDQLLAELEVSKSMYQECLNSNYQLKTQLVLLQKKILALSKELLDVKALLPKNDAEAKSCL